MVGPILWGGVGRMHREYGNTEILPANKRVKYLHYSPIMPGGGPIIPGGGPPTGMRGGPGCCGRI
jgi:hypothetical protein